MFYGHVTEKGSFQTREQKLLLKKHVYLQLICLEFALKYFREKSNSVWKIEKTKPAGSW